MTVFSRAPNATLPRSIDLPSHGRFLWPNPAVKGPPFDRRPFFI